MKSWLFILLLVFVAAPAGAVGVTPPPVALSARVDKAIATTGDLIRFEIRLSTDPTVQLAIPQVGDQIRGFRIVNEGVEGPKREEGRLITTRWYQLQADLVGSYILPPVQVGQAQTPKIFVEVKSVLKPGEAESGQLRDIKPLVHRGMPLWKKAAWLAAIAALIAVLVWAGRLLWRRSRSQVASAPPPPSDQWALAELDQLKSTMGFSWDVKDAQLRKTFYFRLSDIFRGYLERRLAFQATDLTTEETLPWLKLKTDGGELSEETRKWAVQFLRDTDLIKFTDLCPEAGDPAHLWELAHNFVQRTKPLPPPDSERLAS